MMTYLLRRVAGIALLIAGLLGLALSLAGLFIGMPALTAAEATLERRVAMVDQALATTASGLESADASLAGAGTTITNLEITVRQSGRAISDTLPTIDRLGVLVGEEMPRTIRSTQRTLASARETARVADSLLGAISRFGLLGADTYNPALPLNQAIQQVSDDLDPLPASLAAIRDGLKRTNDNLRRVHTDTTSIAANIAQIGGSLNDTRLVITRYENIVAETRSDLASLQATLPAWFGAAHALLALVLVWFGLAQIALFHQGLQLLHGARRARDQ